MNTPISKRINRTSLTTEAEATMAAVVVVDTELLPLVASAVEEEAEVATEETVTVARDKDKVATVTPSTSLTSLPTKTRTNPSR